eukprot:6535426-Pyramimonas_sp.AAC.1
MSCTSDKPGPPPALSPAASWPPSDGAPASAACQPVSKLGLWPRRAPAGGTLRFEGRGPPPASLRAA